MRRFRRRLAEAGTNRVGVFHAFVDRAGALLHEIARADCDEHDGTEAAQVDSKPRAIERRSRTAGVLGGFEGRVTMATACGFDGHAAVSSL